jgi:hypothetical protein
MQAYVDRNLSALLDTLHDCHPRNTDNRIAAAQMLASYPPADPEEKRVIAGTLQAVLDRTIRGSTLMGSLRGLAWPALIGALTGVLIGFTFAVEEAQWSALWEGLPLLLVITVLTLGFALAVAAPFAIPARLLKERKLEDRVRAACATALGQMGSVENIPALLKALRSGDRDVAREAGASLAALVPQLPEEEDPRISERLLEVLPAATARKDWPLCVTLFWATRAAGTPALFETVSRMIQTDMPGEVLAEAQRAFEVLYARRHQVRQRERLLRPSGSVEADATLLRPAGAVQQEEALLLRLPSNSSSQE